MELNVNPKKNTIIVSLIRKKLKYFFPTLDHFIVFTRKKIIKKILY